MSESARSYRWPLPGSCTAMPINWAGLLCFFGALCVFRRSGSDPVHGAIFAVLALAVPIIVLECVFLKTYARASTGLNFSRKAKTDIGRVAVKLTGLYLTLGLAAVYYLAFPEYRQPFYAPYWKLVKYALPIMVFGGIPYFLVLDRYCEQPADGYWHMGILATGRWKAVDWGIVAQHLLGWLVKVFFMALMFSYFTGNMDFIRTHGPGQALGNFRSFYDYAFNMIFAVDLAFVCAGYLLTLRIFDSHLRSVEPTFLGWMAALACYKPFWDRVYANFLHYRTDYPWGNWLGNQPFLYIAWGTAILLLLSVYSYATVSFGIRFSNLTNRGIITNGPYRFLKHPAYVTKNLSWWMISIPFISHGKTGDAFMNSLMLLGVNAIYLIRAKTEEWHLRRDPVYAEYEAAMRSGSVFRKFVRALAPPVPAGEAAPAKQ